MRLRFHVPGIAAPKGSRIVGTRKDGSHFTRPASKSEKPWTQAVATAASVRRPLDPPYEVEVDFALPRPVRPAHAWPSRNDLDKLCRCTLDGLVLGGLLHDDRHITRLSASKSYVETAEACGVTISIA